MRSPTKATVRLLILLIGAGLMTACTEARLAVYGAKQIMGPETGDAGPYKVGSPYQIAGMWYYPQEDPNYDRVGTASWYGPKFHGSLTANGETYDMHDMTAAHPTLPMPSWVRVTNLKNKRSVLLRVNDRGPFKKNRLIDVSSKAAELLDMKGEGTAPVRVTVVKTGGPDGQVVRPQWLESAAGHAQLPDPQTAQSDPNPQAAPAGDVAILPTGTTDAPSPSHAPSGYFIQIGAFMSFDSAQTLQTRMQQIFGGAEVSTAFQQGRTLHKVWVGPYPSTDDATAALASLQDTGYAGAHIVEPGAAALAANP